MKIQDFYVNNVEELENKYGYPRISFSFRININNLPEDLRFLVPYMEYFVSDHQKERERFIEHVPPKALEDLSMIISICDNKLDEWLGGPEADIFPIKPEYTALSLLRFMSYGDSM